MAEHANKPTFKIELSPEQKEQIQQAFGQAFSALEMTRELRLEAAWPEEPVAGRMKPCRWARAYIAGHQGSGENRSKGG